MFLQVKVSEPQRYQPPHEVRGGADIPGSEPEPALALSG